MQCLGLWELSLWLQQNILFFVYSVTVHDDNHHHPIWRMEHQIRSQPYQENFSTRKSLGWFWPKICIANIATPKMDWRGPPLVLRDSLMFSWFWKKDICCVQGSSRKHWLHDINGFWWFTTHPKTCSIHTSSIFPSCGCDQHTFWRKTSPIFALKKNV